MRFQWSPFKRYPNDPELGPPSEYEAQVQGTTACVHRDIAGNWLLTYSAGSVSCYPLGTDFYDALRKADEFLEWILAKDKSG